MHLLQNLVLPISLLCIFLFHPALSFVIKGNRITDLEGYSLSFISDTTLWSISDGTKTITTQLYSFRNNTYLLGGSDAIRNTAIFKRKYTNLPLHDIIYFSSVVSLIGEWKESSSFAFIFDLASYAVGLFNQINYSSVNGSAEIKIYGRAKHKGSSLNLKINAYHFNEKSQSFGLRDLVLLFRNGTKAEKSGRGQLCGFVNNIILPLFNCECPEGQYKSPDGSCHLCNPLCTNCMGPSQSECFECAGHAFFDGTECKACHESCGSCFGPSANECHSCPNGYYFFEENSCVESCNPPLVATLIGARQYCSFPCSSEEFLYPNGRCGVSCSSRFNSIIWDNRRFCSYYCIHGGYFVPPSGTAGNGACTISCPIGFYPDEVAKYCVSCRESLCTSCSEDGERCQECQNGAILDSDGSCKKCESFSVIHVNAIEVGHRYLLKTIPETCNLHATAIQNTIKGRDARKNRVIFEIQGQT